jgi:hypothetical protein
MMTGRCVLPRWPARPVPTELKALENVVLLPHLGSATEETRVMGMRAVENLVRSSAASDYSIPCLLPRNKIGNRLRSDSRFPIPIHAWLMSAVGSPAARLVHFGRELAV